MTDKCVLDQQAVLRFGGVARQVFRDLDAVAARWVWSIARIVETIPGSATVPAWCEAACMLANLTQRGADGYGRLADRAERVVAAFDRSDGAAAERLDRLAVRI
ncbi:hypothetical protein NDR87_19070 [Nocardia sp. CDC159]|uniref:Uncharacterized protein n=1 Tax=Nocardia pulmonis TaxID=2951408 RepID=A0A9X2EDP3_9NOCA|nr:MULTISPECIES: hypothetical protein [Nocardia]MCM6776206.1 hypothetical protein [Nocardia pulmonis]MCM6788468.1 hypothetical protein [Nocardia sp. CDC159]